MVIKASKSGRKYENQEQKVRKQKLRYILFFAVLSFILYGNTIPNDYSFDDVYVTNNLEVKQGFHAIPKIFTSLYANMYEDGKPLTFGYRPVVKASYAIEYGLFGANPHMSHLINVLLYAATGILLFLLLKKILRNYNDLLPFIITVLFMGHPAHTEVVSSLKNRDELMTFLCCIGSLYLFINFIEKNSLLYFAAAVGTYLLGYFAKPTVIIFMVVYPLVFYFFTGAKFWKVVLILAVIFTLTYIAKTLPRIYLPEPNRPVQFIENPLVFEHDPFVKIATGFSIMLFYMKLVIFPHPLVFYYGYNMIPVVNFSDAGVIISVLIHVALFVIAVLNIRKKHILSFGILVYLVSIGTFSNILKPAMGIVADRFLYFPSFGFSIIIAWLLFKLFKSDPKVIQLPSGISSKLIIALVIIMIPYSAKTLIRNKEWNTQVTLLSADIGNLENSAKANLIYSGTMKGELMKRMKKGEKFNQKIKEDIDDVFEHLNKAIEIFPGYYQAYNLRGSCYLSFFKEYKKGLSDFLKSVEIKPDYIPAYFNVAYCYDKLEQTDSAIGYYKKTLEYDPKNFQANLNLVKIYRNMGDYENALYYNGIAREIKDSIENVKKMHN